jgi:glycosyltransferase involved in cell wall biosynthesis
MVTGSYPPQPCGIGDYTARLVRELLASGTEVEVITTRAEAGRTDPVVRSEVENWKASTWKSAVAWMREQGYDLVHIQYPAKFYGYLPSLALLSLILRRGLPGVPLVVTFHEFGITHLLRKLTATCIALPVAKVLLTADSERAALERVMPWLRGKTEVIEMATTIPTLPLLPGARDRLRASLGIKAGEMVIVYFGFLHPNKGIEGLMRSFSLVHEARRDTRLLMLSLLDPGKIPYHTEVLRLADQLGITGSVVWAGYLPPDEVSRHLSAADIGFFPYQDGVTLRRLSFMTAMCHGLPCVTTARDAGSGGVGLSQGGNVLLASTSDDAEAMAGKLVSLVDSDSRRREVGDAARRWAEPFQWSTIVARTTGVYQSLAGRDQGTCRDNPSP